MEKTQWIPHQRRAPERSPSFTVKSGLAQMLKGGCHHGRGVAEHAVIAEEAAVAVMALERVPADIRARRGCPDVRSRSDPRNHGVRQHTGYGQVSHRPLCGSSDLEAIGVDYVDESEVLTPADENHHINKHAFGVPFVCGCRNLGEALRRIGEGAAMIRTKVKPEPGRGGGRTSCAHGAGRHPDAPKQTG